VSGSRAEEASAREQVQHAAVALRSIGEPNSFARRFNFWDIRYEPRRVFSELLGTFLLVLVAAGGGMVNARFGGHAISSSALVVAPGLMVASIILFMGAVSGAHLNPAVSVAFALRGDFPWRRVPLYIIAQFAGAVLAPLLLWALIGRHGQAGLTLPGPGISAVTAMLWEMVLTAGLVSTILGTASGAQQVGSFAAIGVGSYIALAGLWGSPVSGASMNPARSLGPALVAGDWSAWWAYLAGPVAGGGIAVGIAYVLRGPGGGKFGSQAAQGTLGSLWLPGRIGETLAAPAPAGGATRPPPPAKTPPGQAGTPPGQAGTPPGQAGTPPGQAGTPPGQAGTVPGQAGTAQGQAGNRQQRPGSGAAQQPGEPDPGGGQRDG
jgi:aquaporin Z